MFGARSGIHSVSLSEICLVSLSEVRLVSLSGARLVSCSGIRSGARLVTRSGQVFVFFFYFFAENVLARTKISDL